MSHRLKCTLGYITLPDSHIMLANVTQCNLVQKAKREKPHVTFINTYIRQSVPVSRFVVQPSSAPLCVP